MRLRWVPALPSGIVQEARLPFVTLAPSQTASNSSARILVEYEASKTRRNIFSLGTLGPYRTQQAMPQTPPCIFRGVPRVGMALAQSATIVLALTSDGPE